jgi:hypothetical protein
LAACGRAGHLNRGDVHRRVEVTMLEICRGDRSALVGPNTITEPGCWSITPKAVVARSTSYITRLHVVSAK